MVCIDSFKLRTMTALIKSFCGGVQGGQFLQKAPPLAAGGRKGKFLYRGITIPLEGNHGSIDVNGISGV
jgi:hypothetical protein